LKGLSKFRSARRRFQEPFGREQYVDRAIRPTGSERRIDQTVTSAARTGEKNHNLLGCKYSHINAITPADVTIWNYATIAYVLIAVTFAIKTRRQHPQTTTDGPGSTI
jgi:hypothetical protein